jgi:hypothetical protein
LQHSEFSIRTGLGDSTEVYKHSLNTPIHGTGQGSCASPALWLMQSSFLMDIVQKFANGMKMIDVDNITELIQYMEGFVDDISQYTNNDYDNDDIENLKNKLEADGRLWAGLLSAAGGDLELSKCFYYLLSWGWDKYGNPIPQTIQQQKQLTTTFNIADANQTPKLIQQRDIYECHKTLGAFKSICGDETVHIQALMQKSDEIIAALGTGQLNRRQARIAYNCHYIPAILYSTTAMSIQQKSYHRVTMKALGRFLQLMGVEKNFPRAMVFCSNKYGGLGFRQVFTESCCGKIESLYCHISDLNSLGYNMKFVLNRTQMLCGILTPILECHKIIVFIKGNWFIALQAFLIGAQAKIKINNIWSPKLLRTNDYTIMDQMLNLHLTPRDFTTANNWRVYFNVSTIAQIANYSGTRILPQYFERNQVHLHRSTATVKWPKQVRPDISTFRIWKKVIIAVTKCSPTGGINYLGEWHQDFAKTIKVSSMLHKNHDRLAIWCPVASEWKVYHNRQQNYSGYQFLINEFEYKEVDTTKYFPVDMSIFNTHIRISIRSLSGLVYIAPTLIPILPVPNQNPNFYDFVKSSNDWDKQFFKHIQWNGNIYSGLTPDDTVKLCSDGGVRYGLAGCGMVMSINGQIKTRSMTKLKEEYTTLSSFRSEAYGILSAIMMYTKLQQFTQYVMGHRQPILVTIYCDCESLVNKVNQQSRKKFTPKFNYESDADLIREIVLAMRHIRANDERIQIRHVKGHQDRTAGTLSYAAYLNVTADSLATDSLSLSVQNKEIALPNQQVSLYIQNKLVTSNFSQHLRDAFLSGPAREHIKNMNGWSDQEFNMVWWEPAGKALDKYSGNPQLMLQKYLNNRLPTNKRENRYYKYIDSGCHVCHQEETQDHILQCAHCEARATSRRQFLIDNANFLQQTFLGADTIRVINSCIQAWLVKDEVPSVQVLGIEENECLVRAYNEQTTLRWNNWFKGRVSTQWREVYMNDIHERISHASNGPRILDAEAWAIKLIVRTLDFVRQNWQIRNDGEHGTNIDPLRTKKDKLMRKILWQKTKVDYFPNNYLRNLTEETLRGLPLENLKMTTSQFEILIRANNVGQNNEEGA